MLPFPSRGRVRTAALYAALLGTLGTSAAQDPPFTIVLFPDTQNYHEGNDAFHADVQDACIVGRMTTYRCQARWVVDNRAARNVRAVIHLGDITNSDGRKTDAARRAWESVSDAQAILDRAGIPNSVVPGNHDHPRTRGADDEYVLDRQAEWFEWFFPPSRYQHGWYVDSFPHAARANRNNAIRFSSGSRRFLVISLDFAPEKDAACWADSLARALPDHVVIVATHCYQGKDTLRADGTRAMKYQPCALSASYNIVGMDGEDLWDELLALHSNIRLAVSGHVQAGVGYATTPSHAGGQPVHQLLVDYQDEKLGVRKHGAGWIRLLRIDPSAGTLTSEVLSVLGAAAFNARTTSDLCDTPAKRKACYQSDPAHRDHSFTVPFDVTSAIPDRHEEPLQFTDRYVNEVSDGNQNQSRVAMTRDGGFASVWRDDSEKPAGYYEIFGRAFRRNGCSRSHGYRVNQNSNRQQHEPDIAIDGDGRAIVVWADDSRGAENAFQIYARGIESDGRQRFYPITVNEESSGDQRTPRISATRDGRFIVVWRDGRNDAGDIFARGLRADGTELFSEIRVNAGSHAGAQFTPDVATADDGRFVVAWTHGTEVRLRSFSATGVPLAAEQTVATGVASRPALAATPNGQAVIVWRQDDDRILMKRFSIGGTLPTGSTTVTDAGGGRVDLPAVGMAPDGEVVVAWQDDGGDNGWWQIHKREFAADGSPRGGQSAVNKNSRGQQLEPSVDVSSQPEPRGHRVRWVVTWTDNLDRNNYSQILAKGGSFLVSRSPTPVSDRGEGRQPPTVR